MRDLYLGIDPGIYGGISLISDRSKILVCEALPQNIYNSREIIAKCCNSRNFYENDCAVNCLIENPLSMPNHDCVVNADKFANFGYYVGLIIANFVIPSYTSPSHWKKIMKLSEDKSKSISSACILFGLEHNYFDKFGKASDGVAESLLLAYFKMNLWETNPCPPNKPRKFTKGPKKGQNRPYQSTRIF